MIFDHTIKTCNEIDYCLSHAHDLTDEQQEYGCLWRLKLAQAIIEDLGGDNAERIAKIMLAVCENNFGQNLFEYNHIFE